MDKFMKWFQTIFTVAAIMFAVMFFMIGQGLIGILWGVIAMDHLNGVERLKDRWSNITGEDDV